MLKKIKENERFWFPCPFCGQKSFGFKEKELVLISGKEIKEWKEKTVTDMPRFQLVETWGCNSCDIRRFSNSIDYEKAYKKFAEDHKEWSKKDIDALFNH